MRVSRDPSKRTERFGTVKRDSLPEEVKLVRGSIIDFDAKSTRRP